MTQTRREPLTFMEALEAELRKEIRAELLEELAVEATPLARPTPIDTKVAAHERLELWLNARMNFSASTQTRGAIPNAYKNSKAGNQNAREKDAAATSATTAASSTASTSRPAQTEPERRKHALTVEDVHALDFFRRQNVFLREDFTETELKAAYRKIAKLTHPDRHAQSSELERKRFASVFGEAKTHTMRLERHFRKLAA